MSVDPLRPVNSHAAHIVTFRLAGQIYGLPLDNVERAVRMVAVTPTPESATGLCGVINIHGEVIPVLDLRSRLGRPFKEPGLDDRMLILRSGERAAAVTVDEVAEVMTVSSREMEPATGTAYESRLLAAVIRREEGLILMLDAGRLMENEGNEY